MQQFSLQHLFVLVLIVAVYLSAVRLVGGLPAAALVLSIVSVVTLIKIRDRAGAVMKVGLVLLATASLWFGSVDCWLYSEYCRNCGQSEDVVAFRIFTLPVFTRRKELKPQAGCQCEMVVGTKMRLLGCLICHGPCFSVRGVKHLSSSAQVE